MTTENDNQPNGQHINLDQFKNGPNAQHSYRNFNLLPDHLELANSTLNNGAKNEKQKTAIDDTNERPTNERDYKKGYNAGVKYGVSKTLPELRKKLLSNPQEFQFFNESKKPSLAEQMTFYLKMLEVAHKNINNLMSQYKADLELIRKVKEMAQDI